MIDFWTLLLLISIFYSASYWYVYEIKLGEKIFPERFKFQLNTVLMNKYEIKNKKLIRWHHEKIEIVKVTFSLLAPCISLIGDERICI